MLERPTAEGCRSQQGSSCSCSMLRHRWVALLAFLAAACSSTEPEGGPWVYLQPEQTGDGWQTTSLEQAGLDERQLNRGRKAAIWRWR